MTYQKWLAIVKDFRPLYYPFMTPPFEILPARAKSSKNRLNFGKPVSDIDADFPRRDFRGYAGRWADGQVGRWAGRQMGDGQLRDVLCLLDFDF